MGRIRGIMIVLLAVSAAMVVGCENPDAEIKALNDNIEQLMVEKSAIEVEFAAAQGFIDDLRKGDRAKENLLVEKNDEVNAMKLRLAELNRQLATRGQGDVIVEIDPTSIWVSDPRGAKTSIGSDVLFSSGKASLKGSGKKALSKVARDLKGSYSARPVRIYGFTDSDPIRKSKWKDNLELSANRSMAVTRYLISKGIDNERIETIAMGATHFLTSNKTGSGKAKNRRVEIFVIKGAK
jgi:flagellar motor protein MotB